ncbi:MAG: hypothetical protein ACUVWX_03685 [Kiritimatiellia bacterium]
MYEEKVRAWINEARINTLTVMIMEVSCCGGLSAIAQGALAKTRREIPVQEIIVGLDGDIRQEEWLTTYIRGPVLSANCRTAFTTSPSKKDRPPYRAGRYFRMRGELQEETTEASGLRKEAENEGES